MVRRTYMAMITGDRDDITVVICPRGGAGAAKMAEPWQVPYSILCSAAVPV